MLQLPTRKGAAPVLGGTAADTFFARVSKKVGRPAHGASFQASGDTVGIVPAESGVALDVPRSAAALLGAAGSSGSRVAHLVVSTVTVGRTTAAAKAMGITGLVGSYETLYGGDPNRIHNVQLVAHLVDGKLIAPGATFSFNQATGERSAAKGFLEAPVIINGELQTGLGGGVCQVSTTVFNAAYEAGLPITARTNHALYISHYPLGRDATVDYPDVDLKFVNDTPHWLLLRTFVGSSSLVVTLYGAPQHRRVVSEAAPLELVSTPPVQRKLDPSLAPGTTEVQDPGESAYSTSVAPARVLAERQAPVQRHLVLQLRCAPRGPPRRAETEAQAEAQAQGHAEAARYDDDDVGRRPVRRPGRNSLGEPARDPRRPERLCVHRGMRGPALGDHLAGPFDRVLEPEAGAADIEAPRMYEQAVVEDGGGDEPRVRLEHERLDPEVAQPLVAAGEALEELDARHLEPDEIVRVVHDALGVRLGEADAYLRGEVVAVHPDTLSDGERELGVVGEARQADADEP